MPYPLAYTIAGRPTCVIRTHALTRRGQLSAMTIEPGKRAYPPSAPGASPRTDGYDPFARGRYPVGVRTLQARDTARNRLFPCEVWYPSAAQHAGQDIAPATQDAFIDPPRGTQGATPSGTLRRQMAVRN